MAKGKPFFIISCARSGSTSLARILDLANNGTCAIEPKPNLDRQCRRALDGEALDYGRLVRELVAPRVRAGLQDQQIYGEKNVTYAPFLTALHKELDCRFLYLIRDGRDVVASLINWHESLFGNIYRECAEKGNLSEQALAHAAGLPIHLDGADFARPRPRPEDPWYCAWDSFDRFQMCAYYWSRINDLYRLELARLDPSCWRQLDCNSMTSDGIIDIANFLGLEGVHHEEVQRYLDKRINSLDQRGANKGNFSYWKHWDSGQRERFDALAAPTMRAAGYYNQPGQEWKPANFGSHWSMRENLLDWYTWMFHSRERSHRDCMDWLRALGRQGGHVVSVADFGCGLAVGYAEELAEQNYIGVDMSEANIEWCKRNRTNPKHRYILRDFTANPLETKADIVISSGTLDNSYDIEQSLRSMVASSKQWIYATLYRGWFPHLKEHRYSWREQDGCFYNDVSPARLFRQLQMLGCTDILVSPIPTDKADILHETRLIAHVPHQGELG